MPETIWAATRVGLASPGNRVEKITKLAAPSATRAFVRTPAMRWRACRSMPMTAPQSVAKPICTAA